jgi:signal transduction histidine kinase
MADFIFADDYRLEEGATRNFYEEFLKGLVHKHNNLMGVIQGFSSLILYDEGISNEVRESAQQMQDAAKTASNLNREVLISSGCGRCDSDSISLDTVSTYWKSKAEEACAASGVSLQINFREGLPSVSGDSGKLGNVFTQLIKNAAEGSAETPNGSVAIDVFPPGEASSDGTVDLFIRNTSVEMTDKSLKQSFVPFHTTKGAEHYGLGLATAAVLAGQMNSRLGLRYADGTTTAWLALPTA